MGGEVDPKDLPWLTGPPEHLPYVSPGMRLPIPRDDESDMAAKAVEALTSVVLSTKNEYLAET